MATDHSTPRALCIHEDDNVAVLLEDAEPGSAALSGKSGTPTITILEPIKMGHKVAVKGLQPGDAIIKYGMRIGHATRIIIAGSWVHLHNCASDYDEGSSKLEIDTGVPLDAAYE